MGQYLPDLDTPSYARARRAGGGEGRVLRWAARQLQVLQHGPGHQNLHNELTTLRAYHGYRAPQHAERYSLLCAPIQDANKM